MLNKIFDGKNLKNYEINVIASAFVHLASEEKNTKQISLEKLSREIRINKIDLENCIRMILGELHTTIYRITSGCLIIRFCFDLHLPIFVEHAIIHIARKAIEIDTNLIKRYWPIMIVAAAIYMASQVYKS